MIESTCQVCKKPWKKWLPRLLQQRCRRAGSWDALFVFRSESPRLMRATSECFTSSRSHITNPAQRKTEAFWTRPFDPLVVPQEYSITLHQLRLPMARKHN